MKILILSPEPEKILSNLEVSKDECVTFNDAINLTTISEMEIDFLVSYNYRYMIDSEVLSHLRPKCVNLHTSFLPYNRGAHPVLWSVLEKTPLGVTIHELDDGLDTGPIIIQKLLRIESLNQTLRELYCYANSELVDLFCKNWQLIKSGNFFSTPQPLKGTLHKSIDAERILELFGNSWDTPVREARQIYSQYLRDS